MHRRTEKIRIFTQFFWNVALFVVILQRTSTQTVSPILASSAITRMKRQEMEQINPRRLSTYDVDNRGGRDTKSDLYK